MSSNALWEGDRFIRTRCFTRDITDRKVAEDALARHAVELQHSNDELQHPLCGTKPGPAHALNLTEKRGFV